MRGTHSNLSRTAAALPLKDTLRTMRFAMKRGRAMLETPPIRVPASIKTTARAVLSDVDHIADRVNGVVADFSHHFLDAAEFSARWKSMRLEDLGQTGKAEIAFAQLAYRALSHMLRRLGAREALVSEVRAAEAYRAAFRPAAAPADRFAVAARLFMEMRRRNTVQEVVSGRTAGEGDPGASDLADVALFALVLWLVSERPADEPDAHALLAASCDVSRALWPDAAARLGKPDGPRELIATYADKL